VGGRYEVLAIKISAKFWTTFFPSLFDVNEEYLEFLHSAETGSDGATGSGTLMV
jgi:hypothetical protein